MSLDVYLDANECAHCGRCDVVFQANVTHNLNAMAEEAGIYGAVWRPEENGITTAGQLVEPLRSAIQAMKTDPDRFKKHNPANRWGNYVDFLRWLERYLAACEENPTATVRAWR